MRDLRGFARVDGGVPELSRGGPARIAAEHAEEGIRDFQDCVRCHPTGREEEGEGGEGGDENEADDD